MVKYYFYTNQDFARDILSSNAISCSASSAKKRTASLGCCKDTHLFITQKKLKKDIRLKGLNSDVGDFPVTIVLDIPESKSAAVTFAEIKEEGYSFIEGNLAEYKPENSAGIFWKGVIPFSFITGFLFESEDNIKDLREPSSDLWYPEELFSIIPDNEFTDEINEESLKSADLADEESRKRIVGAVSKFRKIQATGYYALKAAKNWQADKYRVNIDPYVMNLLGISKEQAVEKLSSKISAETAETLLHPLSGDVLTSELDPWYKVHAALLNQFMLTSLITDFNEEDFKRITESALQFLHDDEIPENCKKYLSYVAAHLYSANGDSVDVLLTSFKETPVMKALLFVLKYPHSISILESTLEAYKADTVSFRLAEIYYSAVNEMVQLDGAEKDNLFTIRALDEYTYKQFEGCSDLTLAINSIDEYRTALGSAAEKLLTEYKITCERIITFDEVYEFFKSEDGLKCLTVNELKDLISPKEESPKKKESSKVKNKFSKHGIFEPNEYYYRVVKEIYDISQTEIISHESFDLLDAKFKELADEFKKLKEGKESKLGILTYKIEDIHSAFIKPEKEFRIIYSGNEEFWRKKYEDCCLNAKKKIHDEQTEISETKVDTPEDLKGTSET